MNRLRLVESLLIISALIMVGLADGHGLTITININGQHRTYYPPFDDLDALWTPKDGPSPRYNDTLDSAWPGLGNVTNLTLPAVA